MNPHSSSSPPEGSDPFSVQHPFPVSVGDANVAPIEEGEMTPQPLECLQGAQIPPFLSKTFDLGFRKVDTDKWEFANRSFLRGHRYLLKNIQRRKANQAHTNEEVNTLSVEAELEQLRKEKMEMMQEVIELQQQHRESHKHMESVNEKLKAAENKQKQMVSFLAKVLQNPTFVSSMREKKEQMLQFPSPRASQKFVENQPHDPNPVSISEGPEDPFFKGKNVLEVEPDYLLEPVFGGIDDISVKQEDIWSELRNYELPEFGVGDVELSDLWNAGTSGGENWGNDDICFDEIEGQDDHILKKMDP
ncbi:heat shock factor-type, DNA-binding protein [Tanacetum coccineum]